MKHSIQKAMLAVMAMLVVAIISCSLRNDPVSKTPDKSHQVQDTAKNGFALVELYTSEGCSSCPPADKLVAKIAQEYKDKEVYVLTYHVDYWNRLGWKDVFSDPASSARQRAYSGFLNVDGVYTPQAI